LLVALSVILLGAGQLDAQTGTINGRIFDATIGGGVAGVEVTIDGRTVETDGDGRFVVSNVVAGTYTLRATRIGYRDAVQEITVVSGQTSTIEIALIPAPVGLEELVAVGYGEQEKRDVTGVVEEVQAEQFNTGRIVTAEELIQAKVAGVQVTEDNGGEPGGGISMRIRGGTSVSASNEPLYVIDGVPLPLGGGLSAGRNPLNFLNPDDIESFTVLKDASATAIYGSQGANGVVIIETRSGRGAAEGGARITYRGNFSGSNVVGRPDILSASEFRQAIQDQAPEMEQYLGSESTDWVKEVEQAAFGQEHTVSVAGGGNKMNYRISLGYLGQEGVIRASKNERVSLSINYNQLAFDDRLRLQANVLGARNEDQFTPGGVLGNANNFAPTQPITDPDSPYGGYWEWDEPRGTDNPVGQLNLVFDEGTTYRSIGNLTAEYSFPKLDGLSATARIGYVATNSERRFFAPSTNKNQAENGLDGTVSRSNPTEFNTLFDGFLTYARNWTDRHALDVTGGYAYQMWRTESPSFFAQKLSSDFLGLSGIPAAELERTFLTVDEAKLASWFVRGNYTYLDRYLFTLSLRRDGSSKFGPENQWGSFPSAAVAWRISEESFMDSWESLSDLKLRVSWGKNGNQAFANYQQYKDYVFGDPLSQAQFGSEFVSTIRPSAADPNIKWEETSSTNIGFDYGFWNNRLSGSIEYYTKTTDDLIFPVIVAAGTNLSNVVTTNVGSMSNKGFELTVNALLSEGVGDGFSWDANINFAYNKNELTKLNPFGTGGEQILAGPTISGGVGSYVEVLQPGYPVNSFFVYRHKFGDDGKPIVGTDLEMYEDLNGDGVINQDDRAPYESPAPDWIIGHSSFMRWKKFDLSFTLLAYLGNYVYNNVASSTGFYDQLTINTPAPSNVHRSVLENGFQGPQYFSDVYVESASFLRMNNIQLGYTFGPRLRLYGVVQNAFTITGYSGVDPTAGISGVDNNIFPRTRTFMAGLNLAF
jgi:iron complex outermembrane receptor protein